jgi:hypothetical protein
MGVNTIVSAVHPFIESKTLGTYHDDDHRPIYVGFECPYIANLVLVILVDLGCHLPDLDRCKVDVMLMKLAG